MAGEGLAGASEVALATFSLGGSETKLERGRVDLGQPTFIVNLEVKENQGPVF